MAATPQALAKGADGLARAVSRYVLKIRAENPGVATQLAETARLLDAFGRDQHRRAADAVHIAAARQAGKFARQVASAAQREKPVV